MVKLDLLDEGTLFSIPYHNQENVPSSLHGAKFRRGGGKCQGFGDTGKRQHQPLMGGVYQTNEKLLVWLPNNIEVFVD